MIPCMYTRFLGTHSCIASALWIRKREIRTLGILIWSVISYVRFSVQCNMNIKYTFTKRFPRSMHLYWLDCSVSGLATSRLRSL